MSTRPMSPMGRALLSHINHVNRAQLEKPPVEVCEQCGRPERYLFAGLCSSCDERWFARQTREDDL